MLVDKTLCDVHMINGGDVLVLKWFGAVTNSWCL